MTEPRARVVIECVNGHVNYHFTGDLAILPSMIGGLEMAKAELVRKANDDNGHLEWEDEQPYRRDHLPKQEHAPYSAGEVEVTRDIALAMYYQTFEKLRERIHKIGNSAKTATFHVDPSLLNL